MIPHHFSYFSDVLPFTHKLEAPFLVKGEKRVLSFPEVADMQHGAYQLLS